MLVQHRVDVGVGIVQRRLVRGLASGGRSSRCRVRVDIGYLERGRYRFRRAVARWCEGRCGHSRVVDVALVAELQGISKVYGRCDVVLIVTSVSSGVDDFVGAEHPSRFCELDGDGVEVDSDDVGL